MAKQEKEKGEGNGKPEATEKKKFQKEKNQRGASQNYSTTEMAKTKKESGAGTCHGSRAAPTQSNSLQRGEETKTRKKEGMKRRRGSEKEGGAVMPQEQSRAKTTQTKKEEGEGKKRGREEREDK